MWLDYFLCDKIDFVLRTIQNCLKITKNYKKLVQKRLDIFCMSNTKLAKNYKKFIQKWERQTNKQTKTKYRVKTKQSFCIKTKQTKRLIII